MLESLDGRVMPDATPLGAPPASPPGQTEPSGVVLDNLQPGSWVPLDGTTTIAQDGVWLAVGAERDVWIVTQVASNPTFYQIGYLETPPAGGTTGNDGTNFMQPPPLPGPPGAPVPPPGAPGLPPPVLPATPGQNPDVFGALLGGAMVINPTNGANDYPIVFGIGITVSTNPTHDGRLYFTLPGGMIIEFSRLVEGVWIPTIRD